MNTKLGRAEGEEKIVAAEVEEEEAEEGVVLKLLILGVLKNSDMVIYLGSAGLTQLASDHHYVMKDSKTPKNEDTT